MHAGLHECSEQSTRACGQSHRERIPECNSNGWIHHRRSAYARGKCSKRYEKHE